MVDYDAKRESAVREDSVTHFTFSKERGMGAHLTATARVENGKFIVGKGSDARGQWRGNPNSAQRKREELIKNGILEVKGSDLVFTRDYKFDSECLATSERLATAIVLARGIGNGKTSWKVTGTNKTYGEWEAEQAERPDSTD